MLRLEYEMSYHTHVNAFFPAGSAIGESFLLLGFKHKTQVMTVCGDACLQSQHWELQAILAYIASSRVARAMQGDPVLNQKQNKTKQNFKFSDLC